MPLPKEPFPEEKVPAGLDWDVWLNQAAWRPYNGRWRGAWQDMMGGEMTNWGAHGLDQVQWALGTDGTGPVEMWPITPGFNGQVGMRYANGVALNFALEAGAVGGAIFIGEKGKIEINRNKFTSNPADIAAELRKKVNENGRGAEVERQPGPVAGPLALAELARLHPHAEDCPRPTWRSAIARSACAIWPTSRGTSGRKLRWDPAAERFLDDDEANRWVARVRRKGYELPETL